MGEVGHSWHVTVSVPYFRCAQGLRRAVESILEQTHRHLTAVVVNDGDDPPWDLLEDIDDPRLVRFDLRGNRGRYFADAVTLSAADSRYFMVHDADDWSDADRLARLLDELHAEGTLGAISAMQVHDPVKPRGPTAIQRFALVNRPLTERLEHRGTQQGVFRTESLKAVGGCYGGFRIGYDTLLVNFLLMIGRLAYLDVPFYHRVLRPDSLTNSSDTGLRSEARREVADHLAVLYGEAFQAYRCHRSGQLTQPELCSQLCDISGLNVSPEDRSRLTQEASRLRAALKDLADQKGRRSQRAVSVSPGPLLDDLRIPWDNWSIEKSFGQAMLGFLERRRPCRLLELGSGVSTLLLADFARRRGADLVTLEHDAGYYEQTRRQLEAFGMIGHVDLRLAPLVSQLCADGCSYPWYGTVLEGPFEFVFIDGPPERYGRQAGLFALEHCLAPDWTVWLHDGFRDHEQQCTALWRQHVQFTQALSPLDSRGTLQLHALSSAALLPEDQRPSSGLGIGLVAGDHPRRLRQVIQSLHSNDPDLVASSTVAALVNGDCAEHKPFLEGLPFVDHVMTYRAGMLEQGVAIGQLARGLAGCSGIRYILNLDDRWLTTTSEPDWFRRAARLLDSHDHVGQVRLRRYDEKVLPFHVVTREPIRWERGDDCLLAPSAHYTFNPSLMRARDVSMIFPCRTEGEAQRNFLYTGLGTAQLLPGVFRFNDA